MLNRRKYEIITSSVSDYEDKAAGRFGRVLKSIIRSMASDLADGAQPDSIVEDHKAQLMAAPSAIKSDIMVDAALHAFRLTGSLMGQKNHIAYMRAKLFLSAGVVGFGADELIANHIAPRVEKWVEETSKIETQTSARALGSILKKAMLPIRMPDGTIEGLTQPEIAQRFEEEGLAWSQPRARLMSTTMIIWAANEGSMLQYADSGIRRKEWLVTLDDKTCPYCMAMDGKQVHLDDVFARPGDLIRDQADPTSRPFRVELTTRHPPLHPHCRCALIPVVEV